VSGRAQGQRGLGARFSEAYRRTAIRVRSRSSDPNSIRVHEQRGNIEICFGRSSETRLILIRLHHILKRLRASRLASDNGLHWVAEDGALIKWRHYPNYCLSIVYIEVPGAPQKVEVVVGDFEPLGSRLLPGLAWRMGDSVIWLAQAITICQRNGRSSITAASFCQDKLGPILQRPVQREADRYEICLFISWAPNGLEIYHRFAALSTDAVGQSNWFKARRATDIFNDFVAGRLFAAGSSDRYPSEQAALAWFEYLGFLQCDGENAVCALLRHEIADSVADCYLSAGARAHGLWCVPPEVHTRLHLAGVELLLTAHSELGGGHWLHAAAAGLGYCLRYLSAPLSGDEIWFLHDSAEAWSQPHQISSRAFGKGVDVSLTLNTHVQALCVIHDLLQVSEAPELNDVLIGGLGALYRVLTASPAGLLYSALERYYLCSTKLTKGGKARPNCFVNACYWALQSVAPRICMPSGFIQRDLTLSCYHWKYHIVNLKDLLLLYSRKENAELRGAIVSGYRFIEKLDLDVVLNRHPLFCEILDIHALFALLIEKKGIPSVLAIRAIFSEKGPFLSLYYVARLERMLLREQRNCTASR